MAVESFLFSTKELPDVGIKLGAACMPSPDAYSDRATALGIWKTVNMVKIELISQSLVILLLI